MGKINNFWVELTPPGETKPEKLRRSKVHRILYDNGKEVVLNKAEPKEPPKDYSRPSLMSHISFGVNNPTAFGFEFEAMNSLLGFGIGAGVGHFNYRLAAITRFYIVPARLAFEGSLFHTGALATITDEDSGSYRLLDAQLGYGGLTARYPLGAGFLSLQLSAGYSFALDPDKPRITVTNLNSDQPPSGSLTSPGGFAFAIGVSIVIL